MDKAKRLIQESGIKPSWPFNYSYVKVIDELSDILLHSVWIVFACNTSMTNIFLFLNTIVYV